MNFYVVRTIDHTVYHDTRLFLLIVMLVISGYFLRSRGDHRYLVLIGSGGLFHAILELAYLYMGFRAPQFALTVWGVKLEGVQAALYQGLTQGPVLAMMGLWFADLVAGNGRGRETRDGFVLVCALVLGTSVASGLDSQGQAVTSVRPLFGSHAVGMTLLLFGVSAELTQLQDGGRAVACRFLGGVVLFSALHQLPLYFTGARFFIGEEAIRPGVIGQGLLAAWTLLVDAGVGKVHYFAIPWCLGLAGTKEAGDTGGRSRDHFAAD
jgi:hypothetical protein